MANEYTIATSFDEALGYFGLLPNDKLVQKAKTVRRILFGKYIELSDDNITDFVRKYMAKFSLLDDNVSKFVSIVKSKHPFAFPNSNMILRFEDETFECRKCNKTRHCISDLIDDEWVPFSDGWKTYHKTDEEMACIYCQILGADVIINDEDDDNAECVICANCIAYGNYSNYGPDGVFQSCTPLEDNINGPHPIKDNLIKLIEKQETDSFIKC